MRSLGIPTRHGIATLVGILLFSVSPFARAATFVVTKTADTNDGTCDADCSLREAIIAANANPGADTITLPAGTYTLTIAGAGEDGGATGDLDILGDLTINGAGASTTVVDGGGIDRVFHIVSAFTVVFNNITIQGGVANLDNGGGLLNEGTATLNNCVIGGNSAPSGNGGGIYNDDVMTISGCTIGENLATSGDGGGVYDNGVSITITNTWIAANGSPNGDGGGFYFNGVAATISQSTVSDNIASGGTAGESTSTATRSPSPTARLPETPRWTAAASSSPATRRTSPPRRSRATRRRTSGEASRTCRRPSCRA